MRTASNRALFLTGVLCQNFARQIGEFCRISPAHLTLRVGPMRKFGVAIITVALSAVMISPAVATTTVVKSTNGEVLTASVTTVKSGTIVAVTGNHFDETVGIYLGFCVIPKKGAAPTPCGGGVNKAGTGEASFWISSNPTSLWCGLSRRF